MAQLLHPQIRFLFFIIKAQYKPHNNFIRNMLLHYLKVSLREFNKYKAQNIISILGLSVSLLCFSLCLYCSRYLQSIDTCFTKHKQLAELHLYYENDSRGVSGTPPSLIYHPQLRSLPEIEDLCRVTFMRERPYNVEVKEGELLPYTFTTIETDTLYRKLFTPAIIAGSWEDASRTANAVIMSESVARKVFKQPADAIGKHITLLQRLFTSPESTPKTGGIIYTIKAVSKDFPVNANMNNLSKLDILTLNDSEGVFQIDDKQLTGCQTYALVREGASVKDLEKQIKKIQPSQLLWEKEMRIGASLIGHESAKQKNMNYVSGAIGIIGLLVLIAGILNFFHFLTGSFLNRMKEYSIRKVTGGNSLHLFGLLFTQSALLILFATLLVFCFVELFCSNLQITISHFVLHFEPGLISWHICQYIVLILFVCAVICLFTTFRIRKISVQTGIRGSEKQVGKRRLRNIMLGVQFFICWLFVSLSLAFYLQSEKTLSTLFDSLSKTEKTSIFSIPLNYSFMTNEEKLDLVNRIRQHSGIKDIMLSDVDYTKGVSGNCMQTEKGNERSWIEINVMSVPGNFFNFMNIPLLSGRTIRSGSDMVVDKTFADKRKNEVMGTTLYSGEQGYTVCGIAGQFVTTVYDRTPGFAFLPTDFTHFVGHCYVKAQPGHEKEVKEWLRKIQRENLPSSIEVSTNTLLDDIYANQALETQFKNIILFFSLVCLIITILGVYAAITLDTERRRKEVAIRKINGAGISQILFLFARLYIGLLIIPALFAFPLIYLILTFWQKAYTVFFHYGFSFWIGIFGFVAAVTACTILFRILKAARINPATIVKSE